MGNIVGKVWGDTSVLIQNPLVELHRINTKAGYKCSEHKHAHKWNGFYVISGTLEIHVRKGDYDLTDVTVLRAGDFTTVRPGEYHWFKCVEDCSALELYYPEMLTEDIQRRDHGGYEITNSEPLRETTYCVNICKVDPTGQFCIGCNRTLEQIREDGLKYAATRYEGYDK